MKIKTKMDKIKAFIQNNILKTKIISLKWLLINSKRFTKTIRKKNENKDGTIHLSNIEKENTEYVICKLKK